MFVDSSIQMEAPSSKDPFRTGCILTTLVPLLSIAPLVATVLWVFRGLPTQIQGLTPNASQIDWNNPYSVWKAFNWHPVLMTAFLTFGALAIFSFKVMPGGHLLKKIVHAILHLIAVSCAISGFIYIIFWKQKTKGIEYWSLHSWIGLIALGLYLLQFLSGFLSFLLPGPFCVPKGFRAQFVIFHRYSGLIIWVIGSITVITGYMNREMIMLLTQGTWSGLGNPRASPYWGANAITLIVGALVALALVVFRHIKPEQDEHLYSPLENHVI